MFRSFILANIECNIVANVHFTRNVNFYDTLKYYSNVLSIVTIPGRMTIINKKKYTLVFTVFQGTFWRKIVSIAI